MTFNAAKMMLQVGADTREGEQKIRAFVEKQASVLERGFGGMAAAVGVAATVAVVRRVGEAVTEMAKLAQANRAVEGSFTGLAATAGESGEAMLSAMDAAAGGTVSDYNLMLSANKAMMLGVADSAEEMEQLLQIARQRGQAMGLSTQQAFNDIVTGLGRGSALILDNLGIVVDLEQSYASYAAQLGKTAEELTEVEKKQALVNAVMVETERKGAEVISNPFEQMNAALDNLKVSMGELFGPAVTAAVKAITGVFDSAQELVGGMTAAPVKLPMETQLENAQDAVARLRGEWDTLKSAMTERQLEDTYYLSELMQFDPMEFSNMGLAADEAVLKLVELERAQVRLLNVQRDLNAEQWNAGEDVRLATAAKAATEAAVALAYARDEWNKSVADWHSGGAAFESTFGEIERLVNDAAESLVPDLGAGAFTGLEENIQRYKDMFETLREVHADLSDDQVMALVRQRIADDTAARRDNVAVMEEQRGATEGLTAAQEQLGRVAMSSAQELFEAIGPTAWGYLDQLRATATATYNAWYAATGEVEIAQYMARNATAALADELARINGSGLDDVARGAVGATAELAMAAQQAAILNAELDRGMSGIRSTFLGAIDVLGQQGAMALENRMSGALETMLSMMSARGANEQEMAYAARQFTDNVQESVLGLREAGQAQEQTTRAVRSAGTAARTASDGLRDLQGMLGRVAGLFDPTTVTEEDMEATAAGRYKDKPDEYLRQLRAEMLNGSDFEGVDVETAAAAIGWTPEAARANAEMFLNEFTAAWADSSLFADAANIDKFLNIEAVQAALQQQLAAADGEKNLRALFGLGDAEDVSAVAALGLEVQSGLAGWLGENGFAEAGSALAVALGEGVQGAGNELGGGVSRGIDNYISSADGQADLHDLGYRSAGWFADGLRDGVAERLGLGGGMPGGAAGGAVPSGELPGLPQGRPGGVSPQRSGAGGVTVVQYNTVRRPHEGELIAQRTAEIIRRRSR